MGNIERKVYVCPEHGETRDVVGMGRDRAPLHVGRDCGQAVEVVRLVPDTDLKRAVEALRKIAEPTNGIRISAEMAQVVAKGALDSLKGR